MKFMCVKHKQECPTSRTSMGKAYMQPQ